MKLTSIIATLIAAVAAVPGDPTGHWFKRTCENIELKANRGRRNGSFYVDLYANCHPKSGDKVANRMELDKCLGNLNGDLAWMQNGGFDYDCSGCQIIDTEGDKFIMQCYCNLKRTTINLNLGIRNEDGVLWCSYQSASRLS
ncbi:hypothetical protein CGCSCA1_v008966 [Colletotrichum siamense]|nr:hypothetical protein CGCSCA1_v008966 [Colletotrichum siamense]